MEQKILQDVSVGQRKEYLIDSCVKTEVFTYPKHLNQNEITKERTDFTQNAIKVAIEDAKLKEAREIYKAETKPVKQEMKNQMLKIRSGVEEVTGPVFLMDDQEASEMGYYNEAGELVYQRPLLQEERQLRLVDNSNQKVS